ncbi:MAG TPA: hypothetical protein VGQ87_01745 [Patescibacteria group bacterium]|jgi:uncharacterized protein YprB with RNaseH-like and TPR domain|nr:hypothetical protein [Patescibacteria group bacterium]
MTQRMQDASRVWHDMSGAARRTLVQSAGLNPHLAEEVQFDWLPDTAQHDLLSAFDGHAFDASFIKRQLEGRARMAQRENPPQEQLTA